MCLHAFARLKWITYETRETATSKTKRKNKKQGCFFLKKKIYYLINMSWSTRSGYLHNSISVRTVSWTAIVWFVFRILWSWENRVYELNTCRHPSLKVSKNQQRLPRNRTEICMLTSTTTSSFAVVFEIYHLYYERRRWSRWVILSCGQNRRLLL